MPPPALPFPPLRARAQKEAADKLRAQKEAAEEARAEAARAAEERRQAAQVWRMPATITFVITFIIIRRRKNIFTVQIIMNRA